MAESITASRYLRPSHLIVEEKSGAILGDIAFTSSRGKEWVTEVRFVPVEVVRSKGRDAQRHKKSTSRAK